MCRYRHVESIAVTMFLHRCLMPVVALSEHVKIPKIVCGDIIHDNERKSDVCQGEIK